MPSAPRASALEPPANAPDARPRLRGAVHQAAFIAALPLVAWLVATTPRGARGVALVYGLGLLALFGVSALYHRRTWGRAGYARMRRLDHATIFVFIAASYTPITLLGVGGSLGAWLACASWLFALAGTLQILLWHAAPRALRICCYVAMGWMGLFAIAPLARHLGALPPAMLIVGGVIYTAGAVVYAKRRPDPIPRVFGYHEVFHALVVVACGMLFVCIQRCLAVG